MTDRHTDGQTDTQTDRQTHRHNKDALDLLVTNQIILKLLSGLLNLITKKPDKCPLSDVSETETVLPEDPKSVCLSRLQSAGSAEWKFMRSDVLRTPSIRRQDASCSTITSNRRSIGWQCGNFLQLYAEDTKISLNKKGFQTGNKYIYLIYNVIESYCNLNMKIIRTRNILIGGKIDIHF